VVRASDPASHTRTAEAFRTLGLSPALFALLNVLGGRDGAIQQQIAAHGRSRPRRRVAARSNARDGSARR
jgi:hypothetical protein